VKTLVTRTADDEGVVSFTRGVPPGFPIRPVFTQAVNVLGAGGSDSVKSPANEAKTMSPESRGRIDASIHDAQDDRIRAAERAIGRRSIILDDAEEGNRRPRPGPT